jgi:hypothetical protein
VEGVSGGRAARADDERKRRSRGAAVTGSDWRSSLCDARIAARPTPNFTARMTTSAHAPGLMTEIRAASLGEVVRLGYPAPGQLPPIDVPDALRPTREIEHRLVALHGVVAAAFGFDHARARAFVDRERVADGLTPAERRFLATGNPNGGPHHPRWLVESLWTLFWALGQAPALDFGAHVPDDMASQFPDLTRDEPATALRARLAPRPVAEIVRAADLAYCLHWAVRDAELRGAPTHVQPLVVRFRRQALDWCLGEDDEWDDVPLDV